MREGEDSRRAGRAPCANHAAVGRSLALPQAIAPLPLSANNSWKSPRRHRPRERTSARVSRQFNVNRTAAMRSAPHQAMVRIMFGCDRFCTYCVVPSVRGPEQNRPAAEIEEEVRRLADERLPRNHAPRANCQQLSRRHRRQHRPALRSSLPASRDRGLRAAEIRHESSELHERRPAFGRPRLAQGFALFARAGPKWLERNRCGG